MAYPDSEYPDALDDAIPEIAPGDEQDAPDHGVLHNAVRNAILAIQGVLGTLPAGAWDSVKDRLADMSLGVVYADSPEFDGAANDGARITAACAAAYASGVGVVQLAARTYTISGSLLDTSNANAQILLPDVHALDDAQFGLEIRGVAPQSACSSVVGAAVTPETGTIIESTLASGTGAIIGAYGSGTSYQNFTFLDLTLRNLTVRTVNNPTITGLDLRRVNSVTLQKVIVDTGQYDSALTEPTSSGSYGIRLPKNNNGAHVVLRQVDVFGFYNGIEHSEHADLDEVAVGGVNTAFVATAANHSSHYKRILVGYCKYGLRFTGAHALDIEQWACEHATSGWYQTTYDVDDPSNYGKGFIRWWAVQQGVGPHNSFVKNGGSGVSTSRLGDAIGSGGSTIYHYRDRLTAATGNDTLTLGATPVTNSPLVWKNGTIQWPSTNYTIVGNVITFSSALTSGDIIAVHYESSASSASAAALSGGVNIVDTFTRADSTSALGSTSTGSKAWTQHAGTWGIASNKAYVSNGHAGMTCLATIDADVADCTVAATLTSASGAPTGGIIFRADGSGNQYVVEIQLDTAYTPKIYKGVGGSYSVIATGSSTTVASGSVLSVVLSGSSIIVKDDGVTIVSVTDSSYNSNDRHGMYLTAGSGSSSTLRFDDFTVSP